MDVELPADFRECFACLNARGVEYLLVGGYAVGYHGYPQATNAIDVWVRRTEENAQRIVLALQDFGFSVPELSVALFLDERRIIRIGRPPLRIGIATTLSGVDFDSRYESRDMAGMGGLSIPIIHRDHLLANKRSAGRPKDLADVDFLEPQQRPKRTTGKTIWQA